MSNRERDEPVGQPRHFANQLAPADVAISIVVAFNFAIAQPLLDLLGRNASFFVAHDLQGAAVAFVGLTLTVILPGLFAGVLWLFCGNLPRLGAMLHVVALSALLGSLVLIWGARSSAPLGVVLGGAVVAGAMGAAAFRSHAGVRQFFRFGLVAPPAFLLFFLLQSPASALVFGDHGTPAEATAETRIGRPAPLVFLMLDEFPLSSLLDSKGEIDADRYPNFQRLAAGSTWFRRATTVHPSTEHALPAMLTGFMPSSPDHLPIANDHPPSLFEFLLPHYDALAVEPVTRFCTHEQCRHLDARDHTPGRLRTTAKDMAVVYLHVVLPHRLAATLPPIDERWAGFGDQPLGSEHEEVDGIHEAEGQEPEEALDAEDSHERRLRAAVDSDAVGEFRAWVDALELRSTPTLYFGHFMMPHEPWLYLPSGARYLDKAPALPGKADTKTWGSDDWFTAHGYRRHLLQVEFTDRLVGEFLDQLERSGLWDEALVIVTSDHGTTFLPETRRRSADDAALGEVAYVPLFIKPPGGGGSAPSGLPVQSIDIVPTIADVLEIDPRPDFDGQSVFDAEAPRRESFLLYQGSTTLEYAADGSHLADAVDRKYAYFPRADEPMGLFRAGPYGELVGSVADPLVDGSSSLTIKVGGIERFERVDPGSTFLPALLRGDVGSVDDGPVLGRFIAFVLDGRVAGLAKTYEHASLGPRYEALLEPSLFRAGSNRLDAYEVVGEDDAVQLLEVRIQNR